LMDEEVQKEKDKEEFAKEQEEKKAKEDKKSSKNKARRDKAKERKAAKAKGGKKPEDKGATFNTNAEVDRPVEAKAEAKHTGSEEKAPEVGVAIHDED
jgi:Protein of unknown function (DUF1168)